MLLSIAMIVKNEEKNLDRCLSALRKLDDKIEYEIIVVDTGSNDSTIEIAKKYTNKVYEYKWNDDFAEMRNISIRYCTGQWILILDADEVIEDEKAIIRFFNSNIDGVNSANIRFKNLFSDNDEKYILCNMARLFRNYEGFCYKGIVHEQPIIEPPVVATDITVKHYGYYAKDYKLMEYKYKRNKELLLKDLEQHTDIKSKIYTYFQLAQTYGMANRSGKAREVILKAYELAIKSNEEILYLYVYHFYALNSLSLGNYEKAIKVANRALKYTNVDIDFYYVLFKANYILKKYNKANDYYEEYMSLHRKIENGEAVKSFVNVNSYCNKDEILIDKISMEFESKNTNGVIELFSKIKDINSKKSIEEVYLYSLFKEKKYSEFNLYIKEDKISEQMIQKIVNVLERLEQDGVKAKEYKVDLLGIDSRIDTYINLKYSNLEEDIELEFKEFYKWKGEIFKLQLLKNSSVIDNLIKLSREDKIAYINYCIKDYICLGNFIKYTKVKFQNNNFEELLLLSLIEEILLLNDSIGEKEYREILNRAIVNSNYVIEKKYNIDILNSEYSKSVLTEYEYMMLKIKSLFKVINSDKKSYIRKLKELLDSNPSYNNIFKYLLRNISDTVVSNEMIVEKDNLVVVIEDTISRGNLEEGESVLNELEDIFKYDEKLMTLKGIVEYFKGNIGIAIETLSLGAVIYNNNFDMIYNLATILENKGYYNNAKLVYEQAKNSTNLVEYKDNIEKIILELQNKI